jgi:hypothetical protein
MIMNTMFRGCESSPSNGISSNVISGEESAGLASPGVPLFTTNLHMPDYLEGIVGRWRLKRSGICFDRGYHSGLWIVSGMPVLLRDALGDGQSWETWMSLSPHEIESQELGCRYACGHTVVMGLGMGWVAVNMALNPQVKRVTVVERDPEVVELFLHSRALAGIPSPCSDKLSIVLADALEWQPDEPVDFLYADIWLGLEEPQTLDEVRRMQDNVKAGQVYFWGQELVIHSMAGEYAQVGTPRAEVVQRCIAEKIRLPLLIPDGIDYAEMIDTVVRQRRERFPDRKRA